MVRVKRHVRSTDERGVDQPHAPVTVDEVVRQLWRQHFIALETERITFPADGLASFGEHSVPVRLGDGETETRADLTVRMERR